MLHSYCQEPLFGLVNKPISMPTQWAWVKAGSWSPKPSPNDALNPGDPGILAPFCLHHYHLTSAIRTSPQEQQGTTMLLNNGKFPGRTWGHHTRNDTEHYKKAETKARDNKTYGPHHPQYLHLCWIMGSRVTKVQCQLPPQCYWGPIDLEVPGIHTMANNASGSLEIIRRSMCQSSRMKTWRMPLPIKVGAGIFNSVSSHWVLRLHPSPLCHPFSTRLPGGDGEKFGDRHCPRWCTHHTGWALQQCQCLRCLEPGALSATHGWERDSVGLGVHLSRYLQVLAASFPECFPLDYVAKLKCDCSYGGLPKWFKAMVAYLKASTNEKMYSDYLPAVREAEKEDVIEPSHSQTADSPSKPKAMIFFPLWKLKSTQPARNPAVWVAHLAEDRANKEEGAESEDPDGIKGMTEEFIVYLARAMKEAQQEEKCCCQCNSPEHFIYDCLLVKASRTDPHLNQKEGMALKKGVWAPPGKATILKVPQDGIPKV